MTKKVGILGSGEVAQALGKGFVKHGYEVMMGTREGSKLDKWKSEAGGNALVGSFAEAAKFGDIVVAAVKGTVVVGLIKSLSAHLAGKTVIDPGNPIADAPPVNGVLKFFTGPDDSLLERLQKVVPAAHFVKAFSSVGSSLMVNPVLSDGKPTMFIAGNNDKARAEVSVILDQFGWETADMGKAEAARAIEPLAILWCIPGFVNNQWKHAFKLMKE